MGIWDKPVQEAEVVIDKTAMEARAEAVAEVKPVEIPKVEGFKGLPVRGNGDRIYLLKGGKKMWITNAEVYEKLGFKFGDEKELDFETLQVIPDGDALR